MMKKILICARDIHIISCLVFLIAACGGEDGNGSAESGTEGEGTTAFVDRCAYSWEVPSATNTKELVHFEGVACTNNRSVCIQPAVDYADQLGFTISSSDVEIQLTRASSCTPTSGSKSKSPNPNFPVQTIYGIGATSIGDVVSINSAKTINELRKNNLDRDSLQIPPTVAETQAVLSQDEQRKLTNGIVYPKPSMGSSLLRRAGVSDIVPFYVEDDLRLNLVMGPVGGGHAGHSYFSVDGKFINIMREVADYNYYFNSGQVSDNRDIAIDAIIRCHLGVFGALGRSCYYYPSSSANHVYESMYGAIVFHEYAHYFLMHAIDTVRARQIFDVNTLFQSIQEDDADFIAGALAKKANLDLSSGQFMFDLMTLYSIYKSGGSIYYSQLNYSYQLQFTASSPRYSSLSVRRENYARGYRSY